MAETAARRTLIFVCTGNTCRSPMAEALLRHELLRHNGLERQPSAQTKAACDWTIASAGVAASNGMPASGAAVRLLQADGIDLSRHRSRQLTAQMANTADVIIALTRHHLLQVRALFPDCRERLFLLGAFADQPTAADYDVADPVGAGHDAYRQCREHIARAIPGLAAFLASR